MGWLICNLLHRRHWEVVPLIEFGVPNVVRNCCQKCGRQWDLRREPEGVAMASWKQVTEYPDGSTVLVNMENVTHIRRAKGDQTTTVFFASGAGNEVYVIARETPEEILMAQPLRSF